MTPFVVKLPHDSGSFVDFPFSLPPKIAPTWRTPIRSLAKQSHTSASWKLGCFAKDLLGSTLYADGHGP
jgi:hypothetical protein